MWEDDKKSCERNKKQTTHRSGDSALGARNMEEKTRTIIILVSVIAGVALAFLSAFVIQSSVSSSLEKKRKMEEPWLLEDPNRASREGKKVPFPSLFSEKNNDEYNPYPVGEAAQGRRTPYDSPFMAQVRSPRTRHSMKKG